MAAVKRPMNKGEADSMALDKLREAKRIYHAVRDGVTHAVSGFRKVDWRCLRCGARNQAPVVTQCLTTFAYCHVCHGMREQERIFQ